MPRLVRLASIIKENSPLKCYKTISDVYKHALYLGLQLIYRLGIKKRIEPEYGKSVQRLIQENEKFLQEVDLLEDVKDTFKKLAVRCEKGYLSLEKLLNKCKKIIKEMPDEIKNDAENELNKTILEIQGKRANQVKC